MGDLKAVIASDLDAAVSERLDAAKERLASLLSLDDVQFEARRRLPKAVYEYVASGSEDEQTLWENRQGFKRILLWPRVLRDVSAIDTSLSLFGGAQRASMPVFISPAGVHCLMDKEGEAATARASRRAGIIMGVSQHATKAMEEVMAAARDCPPAQGTSLPAPSPLWYQLYILKDRELTLSLLRRAERAGYQAIILTVDSSRFGYREADWRNGFSGLPDGLTLANYPTPEGWDERKKKGWDQNSEALLDASSTFERDIPWLRSHTKLPIILKGILRPEDALAAAQLGCEGIIVSNHGGRQLDACLSSIEALEPIAHALRQNGFLLDADLRSGLASPQPNTRGPVTLLLDSGVRRGTDVLKALALGASAVLLGKPVFFGLAVAGEAGVLHVLKTVRTELESAMALSGCASLAEITRDLVVTRPGGYGFFRPSKL